MRTCKIWGVCIGCTLLFFLFPLRSFADGGAPNLAYVAGTSHGVSVIDIGQQNVNTPFSIDGNPHTIYLSLDGRFLYITQPSFNRVMMLAARTGQTICTANVPGQPSLLAFDPGANVLYAAGNGATSVTALDPANCNVERTLSLDSPVYGLAVAVVASGVSGGNGNQLWVADSTSLTIFDYTGKQLESIPVPGGPQYVTIPAGATVYVTTRQGTVDAIELHTHQLIASLLSGGSYGPMDYDAITGEVYVPDLKSHAVDVLTPLSSGSLPLPHEPSHVISLGVSPQAIAITSDGQLGFVALEGGNVAMLDIPGKAVVKTFHVGGNPRFIIIGLYPPLIGTTPQQASIWETVMTLLPYAEVIALLMVPLLLLSRYSRAGVRNKGKKKER